MSEVGGYTLDLYCDYKNEAHDHREFPHQFYNQTRESCRRMARKAGWVFKHDLTVQCPCCAKMRITEIDESAI